MQTIKQCNKFILYNMVYCRLSVFKNLSRHGKHFLQMLTGTTFSVALFGTCAVGAASCIGGTSIACFIAFGANIRSTDTDSIGARIRCSTGIAVTARCFAGCIFYHTLARIRVARRWLAGIRTRAVTVAGTSAGTIQRPLVLHAFALLCSKSCHA